VFNLFCRKRGPGCSKPKDVIYEFAKVFSGKFARYQTKAPGFEVAKNFVAS